MKKVLKFSGLVLILGFVLLAVTPYLFKDRIVTLLKQNLNENLEARTDFDDISLSFFRSFPSLSARISGLRLDGIGAFDDTPLFHAEEISVAIDFWTLLDEGPIRITSLQLESPRINILVLADGRANYDIVVSSAEESSDETNELRFAIDQYELQSAHLRYEDQSLPMILAFDRFDHSGKGDFASMQFDLVTLTEVEGFSLIYDGITYFNGASIQLGATMEMDLDELRYTLKENKLNLNELELSGEGFIDLNDDDIELDLSFSTSKSDFRQLVSVLPGAYIDDFNQVQIEGTFEAESQISGIYSDDQLPAFNFSAVIEDGSIKYPDLPLGMNKINLDLSVEKPAGVMDLVSVALEQIQLEIGQQPLSGHLLIRTPVSDPDVTGRIVGRLDLANLTQAYPLQDVETLSGIIDSDVRFRASQSQLDKKDYKNMEVNGSLDLVDLIYVASGSPEINIIKSGLTFSPEAIHLSETQMTAGQSDISISGKIENILSLLNPEKTLVGSLNLRSERLDLDEWYHTDATLDSASTTPTPSDAFATPDKAIPAYDFDFDLQIKELVFNGESITELKARSRLRPEQINIVEMSAGMRGSDIRLEGTLNNLTGYLAGESKVTGDVTLTSRRLNLNAFMSEETGSNNVDTAVLSPFIVPDNIDVAIDAKISELIYTDMIFKDLSGQVMIRDQTADLKDCSTEAFGGSLQLAGGYRTTKGEKPHFDLKYDMRNVQFSQVAQQFSYLGVLAPIIKYLDGRFSTSFISNGVLQGDFMPDLSTLNLDGLVETSECILKSFGPAEELGRKLKMNFLQSPKIKNTKNWVEVRNGMVEIKEFDYLLEDVAMQIAGTQSLTQELNYLIKMKVPRKYLDAKELTKEFNTQFSWLTEEANKLGFRLSNGEFINVNVILTGTISKPVFNLKLVGMDGEKPLVDVVKDEVKAGVEHVVDSAKNLAEARRDSLFKQGEEKADKLIDTLAVVARQKVDTLSAKASEEIKKKLNEEISKQATEVIDDKVGEIGGEKAKEQVDKALDKLKDWKPFGKKKEETRDTTSKERGN